MFMCQRNSFLKQYESEVVSCSLVEGEESLKTLTNGGGNSKDVFQVVLKDTILFPEGGGQPDDRGKLNGMEVLRVVRNGTTAVHYVIITDGHSLKTGDKVNISVDWDRRFDHMQQHSGQHLVTAVADSMYGFGTTSWWLGSEESFIELGTASDSSELTLFSETEQWNNQMRKFYFSTDTKEITEEQIEAIEDKVNQVIRESPSVSVDVVELDDPKLKAARGRNLPDDVKGQIRIVTMEGIESNVCCGTHVTNLSQLQVIKLLNVVKKKGKCLLYFLAGNRVIKRFSQQFQRDQKLMGVLKCPPDEFIAATEKLNTAFRSVKKTCQNLSRDLAALEAKKLLQGVQGAAAGSSNLILYHRENVDLDFGTSLLREMGSLKSSILLVTLKVEGNSGHFMLVGGEDAINKDELTKLGNTLCEVLDGKGSLRGNTFQAKVNKINGVSKAVKLAQEFVNQLKANIVEANSPEM